MELKILKQDFSIGNFTMFPRQIYKMSFAFLLKPTRRIHWSAPRSLCLTT